VLLLLSVHTVEAISEEALKKAAFELTFACQCEIIAEIG